MLGRKNKRIVGPPITVYHDKLNASVVIKTPGKKDVTSSWSKWAEQTHGGLQGIVNTLRDNSYSNSPSSVVIARDMWGLDAGHVTEITTYTLTSEATHYHEIEVRNGNPN